MNALLKLLPEPTKDQTARRAMDALAAQGIDRAKITYEPDEFQLRVDGNRLWLGNLQAQCRLVWPWQRATVTRQFLSSCFGTPDRPKTIVEARPHLLPGVRDSFVCETLRLQAEMEGPKPPAPSGHALGSRLWLSAFLDYPNSTSIVTASDLASWGASSERCLELALENLAGKSKEGLVQVTDGLYHSPWQDCHDPARMLLRDVLGPLSLRGDPVAFAPNWNHLIVTGSEDLEGLAGGLLFAMKVLAEEAKPITALPLVRRGGQWVDFDLPKSHVLEPLLRKTRVLELKEIYPEQARLIEKTHEKDGTDIYIAKYNASHNERTDQHDSYAVWSKGVVTLLPRVERVVFFDNNRPERQKVVAEADWAIVALHCTPLMKDAGYTPPRYLVEGFPTTEQLEAMKAAQASRAAG
jgi:hypothetical protein